MKALIAIMFVAFVYVACTRKDEAPTPPPEAPAVEAAPPVTSAPPDAGAAVPPPAATDPHAGHGHAPGEEHK